MKKLNWEKIIHDTYVELYKNAEPQADFDELLINAEINERGQKVIPFMDYEISDAVMSEIMDAFKKEYHMSKRDQYMYDVAILLGCSPKTKACD